MICPYCKSEIPDDAVRCPKCTTILKYINHTPAFVYYLILFIGGYFGLAYAVELWKYADPIFIYLTNKGMGVISGLALTISLLYIIWPFILILIIQLLWYLFKKLLFWLWHKLKN